MSSTRELCGRGGNRDAQRRQLAADRHPSLGALVAVGSSGKKWRFKSSTDGVQQVTLQSAAPSGQVQAHGQGARLVHRHGHADQPAASTVLSVQIGTACFTHAATRKLD